MGNGCCGGEDDVAVDPKREQLYRQGAEFDYDPITGEIVSVHRRATPGLSKTPPVPHGSTPSPSHSFPHPRKPTADIADSSHTSIPLSGQLDDDNSMLDCQSVAPTNYGSPRSGRASRTNSIAPSEVDTILDETLSMSMANSMVGPPPIAPSPGGPEAGMTPPSRGVFSFSNRTNVSCEMSADEWAYILEAPSMSEKVQRLDLTEEIRRSEIYATYLVATKVLQLAKRRITPTVRYKGQSITRRHHDKTTTTIHIHHSSISVNALKTPAGRSGATTPDPSDVASEGVASASKLQPGQHSRTSSGGGSARHQDPNNMMLYSPTGAEDDDRVPPPALEDNVPDLASTALEPGSAVYQTDRFEILDLDATRIAPKYPSKPTFFDSWDFLSKPDATDILNRGDTIFGFCCKTGTVMKEEDLFQMGKFLNLTGFEDEARDNNVPFVDPTDKEVIDKHVICMVKAMYHLDGFDCKNMTRDLMASIDYQKNCQPGPPKFDESCQEPHTFRCTKSIIRFIYSICLQLRTSVFDDPEFLRQFRDVDGLTPAKMVLLERTKRDKNKVDSTVKCKSVLLYYPVPGGTLVTNITVLLNTSIPSIAARVVNNFGSQGAEEAAETAFLTRKYLVSKFGDCRGDAAPPEWKKKK